MEEREVTLKEILDEGFVFSKLSITPAFVDKLKELKFEEHKGQEELYVQGESFLSFDHWISGFLRRQLKQTTKDESVLDALDSMHFVVTKMNQGDRMNMHTDIEVNKSSVFHVCIWFPEEQYEGRDFIYGTKDNLQVHHPAYGDCVFINTINTDFVHGVSSLSSRSVVVSVGGYPCTDSEEDSTSEKPTAIHYGSVKDYLNEFERGKTEGLFIRKNISEHRTIEGSLSNSI